MELELELTRFHGWLWLLHCEVQFDTVKGSSPLQQPGPLTSRTGPMSTITIYHNPACCTSRNTLPLIRNSRTLPQIIEYLKTPPTKATLQSLIAAMGISPRALLREKGTSYAELGLADAKCTDEQLVDFMRAHPILINRPVLVTPLGVRLCRPSELALDLLPNPQQGAFTKEDGDRVIDEQGRRI